MVLLTDVLDADGERVAKDIGGAARYQRLDVGAEEDWAAAVFDPSAAQMQRQTITK